MKISIIISFLFSLFSTYWAIAIFRGAVGGIHEVFAAILLLIGAVFLCTAFVLDSITKQTEYARLATVDIDIFEKFIELYIQMESAGREIPADAKYIFERLSKDAACKAYDVQDAYVELSRHK